MIKYLFKNDKLNFSLGILMLCLFSLNKALLSLLIIYNINMANRIIEFNLMQLILVNLIYLLYYFSSSYFSEYFLDKLMVNSRHILNMGVYKSLLPKDDTFQLSSFSNLFTNDIPVVSETYMQGVINCVYFVISFISASFVVSSINSWIFIYLFFVSTITLIVLKIITNHLSKKQVAFTHSMADIIRKLNETLLNIKLIKIYNRKSSFLKKFELTSIQSKQTQFEMTFTEDLVEVINQSVAVFIELGMYILSVILIYQNKMNVASIVAVVASAEAITLPIYSFSRVISKFQKTKALRINLLRIIKPSQSLLNMKIKTIESIQVDKMSVLFDDTQINQPFSMAIKQGEKHIILGNNGAGKSSLIDVLTGGNVNYIGNVRINETEFSTINKESYFHRLSYVPQKITLFEDSIKNNIILDSEFDSEKYQKIIEVLGLNLVGDKEIEEGQFNFSGGEKQKIMIARALYKESDIIILDEPFASLDLNCKERLLQFLINDKRTIIMVVHDNPQRYVDYGFILNEIVKNETIPTTK